MSDEPDLPTIQPLEGEKDNIPMDWPTRGRSGLLLRLSENHWRRLMVDFAKFVQVHALDALEPDELLDAWLEQTYNKPAREEIKAVDKYGYRESPRSESVELVETPFMEQSLPAF